MRAIMFLLLSLPLAACGAGTRLSGDQVRSGVTPSPAAEAAAPSSVTTAAAAPAITAAASQAPAPPSGPRDLTEAKVICWGKVEREKQRVRTIDQRIAYVERCVADQMKTN